MNTEELVKQINIKIQSLKDLSADDVKIFIGENVSLVLSGIILLLVIIILGVIANFHFKEYNDLQIQLSDLHAKEDPVKEQAKVKQDLIKFKQNLRPSIVEDQIISYITTLAEKRKIVIESFDPLSHTTKNFFSESVLLFSCRTKAFSNAILFIKDLEDSKFFIKVDGVDMSKVASADMNGSLDVFDIKFNMKLSAVRLLNDASSKSKN